MDKNAFFMVNIGTKHHSKTCLRGRAVSSKFNLLKQSFEICPICELGDAYMCLSHQKENMFSN